MKLYITSFAQKSGEGTPMFSRNGKSTIASYIAFKEPHIKEESENEDEEKKQKKQLKKLQKQIQKEEKHKRNVSNTQSINKLKQKQSSFDHGEQGNQSMFRSVGREQLDAHENQQKIDGCPHPAKYRPQDSYINKKIIKNVDFGEKTEIQNQIKLNAIYEKIRPNAICTKGVSGCFQSVKRVKGLTKTYIDQVFSKNQNLAHQPDEFYQNIDQKNSKKSLKNNALIENNDEPSAEIEQIQNQKSKFFADSSIKKRQFNDQKMFLKKLQERSQSQIPFFLQQKQQFSSKYIDITDQYQMKKIQNIEPKNQSDLKQKLIELKKIQEVNDNLHKLMDIKQKIESKAHPQPGKNTKRTIQNSCIDVNISPVNFQKSPKRIPFFQQIPRLDGPIDSRFEPFNLFPAVASKYSTLNVNMVPLFQHYSDRPPIISKEQIEKNQVQVDPNFEYIKDSLKLGYINFDQQMDRERRDFVMKRQVNDKDVKSPDMYTHHDNAISTMINLKSTTNHVHLSPNQRFDNSPGRDESMYYISDLSNLNHMKYINNKNSIDRYLELENILPHQTTLARGFQKGSNYDNVVSGYLQKKNFTKKQSQIKEMNQTQDKIRNGDSSLDSNQPSANEESRISQIDQKQSTFKNRSRTIADNGASLQSYNQGIKQIQDIYQLPPANNIWKKMSTQDISKLQQNYYIQQLNEINIQNEVAKKLEILKLSHMSEINPNYKLTKDIEFTLYPENRIYNKKKKETSSNVDSNTKYDSYQETTPEELKLYKTIRRATDKVSLFSDDQISSMTLEQKMLAGFYQPKKSVKEGKLDIELM